MSGPLYQLRGFENGTGRNRMVFLGRYDRKSDFQKSLKELKNREGDDIGTIQWRDLRKKSKYLGWQDVKTFR